MQLPDAIPYKKLMAYAHASGRPIDEFLREQLPLFWQDAYDAVLARPSDVMVFTYGTFDYWFDTYQPPEPYDPSAGKLPIEARLVFAIGTSKPKHSKRDDYRLRGMKLSAMPDTHGPWDRGHFVGHALVAWWMAMKPTCFCNCAKPTVGGTGRWNCIADGTQACSALAGPFMWTRLPTRRRWTLAF